jgi:hypothetical protein
MINAVKVKKAIKVPPPVIRPSKPLPLLNKQLFWHLFLKQVELQKIAFKIEKQNEKIIYCVFRYFLQMENFNEFGLIKNKASLSKGLLVYGDYGVGKSIMLGALGFLLGKRADYSAIRFPRDKCIIEGNFEISNYHLKKFFETEDLDYEDQTIIRREILSTGKSRAFINDTPVTLLFLGKLGDLLIDIHGQHQP